MSDPNKTPTNAADLTVADGGKIADVKAEIRQDVAAEIVTARQSFRAWFATQPVWVHLLIVAMVLVFGYYARQARQAAAHLLTSPWDTPGCHEGKMDWVKRHAPRYKHRTLVGTPKEACSFPGSALVDDAECDLSSGGKVRNTKSLATEFGT